GGSALDWSAVEWATTDPALFTFDQGRVTAGPRGGTGRLILMFGGQRAQVSVSVRGSVTSPVAIRAPRRVSLGSIRRMDVAGALVTTVSWSTSRPEVLRDLG